MDKKITRRGFVGTAAGLAVLGMGGLSALGQEAASNGEADSAAEADSASAEGAGAKDYTSTSGKTLKVICTNETYQELFNEFSEASGAPVEFISMSSGEALSKLKAQGGTPDADVWFGGGIDSFMSAKDDGLLEQCDGDWTERFNEGFKDDENYWFSKGVTVVGFIVNNDILEEIGAEAPAAWTDLTDESYQGEILMSSPAISGTNYAVLNALLQNMGEEKGWEYFEALDKNIPFYTRRGSDPSTRVAAGEAAIGITYIDGTLDELLEDGTLQIIYPSDGMPYMPDGVAVFKGADDVEDAKLFLDWLFSNDANLQKLAEIDQKGTMKLCIPDIEGVELDFDTTQLLDEDLSLFGSQRDEILARFDELGGDKTLEG